MDFELSYEEGEYLVGLARRAIESQLRSGRVVVPDDASEHLKRECGVFVTLNVVEGDSHRLRGCIGFPYPTKPLVDSVVGSAVSAALKDPRFPVVTYDEMGSIAVEVSVLTPPDVVSVESPEEYLGEVKVGRDGLMISRGGNRGFLLPQVPVEWGWDTKEFLSQCCIKARLPPDAWLLRGTEVSKFQAIIFSEEEPRGEIKRVEL